MVELINRIVYDEIKNHAGLVIYLALLEFNLRENFVMVFKLNMTLWQNRLDAIDLAHCIVYDSTISLWSQNMLDANPAEKALIFCPQQRICSLIN